MKTMKHNDSGFTLIEIMIVVAIIIILATLAVPAFNQARLKSQAAVCVNNLRQIDGASDQFHLETGAAATALDDLIPDYIKRTPECPDASGGYALGDPATCTGPATHTL